MMCGKIAAGKSTLCARLAADGAVVIAEDDWLAALHAGELTSVADYVRRSARLRAAMGPHVVALLRAGVSVALDFPANTPRTRAWMRGIVDEAGCAHALHVLDVPDEVCLARLRARNAAGDHAFAATEAQFHEITRHFTPPAAEEGFNTIRHAPDGA
ncbi:AAA family ATPase [Rhodovulum sp. DZ06]|uniref:AAA family ATPase n=1 Tax=Rhodovulum sp. DZ06 TaxID=3425126 RepID=UPI003D3330C5